MDRDREVGDEVLDEIEGKALVILEHPDRYPPLTVVAASQALKRVQTMRRSHGQTLAPQSQSA